MANDRERHANQGLQSEILRKARESRRRDVRRSEETREHAADRALAAAFRADDEEHLLLPSVAANDVAEAFL